MAAGYFLTDWFLYGLPAVFAASPMNLFQGIVGAAFLIVFYKVLRPILK